MKTEAPTTFPVSDVRPATEPLREVPYKEAVEALLRPPAPPFELPQGLQLVGFGPASPPSSPVEACTRYHGRLVAGVEFHPVVAAVHEAFQEHRPLRISPDAIWLMIAQAVANHVNAHAEELRPKLVRHEGKATIVVRRDDFIKGSPENPWAEVCSEFSGAVRNHVGPAADLFTPAFSTTGPAERTAAEIVLLDAVRSYFQYDFQSMCGIPSITLEGTPGDWEALATRAEGFAEFGLGPWIEILRPILGQFARASRGDVETPFWRSLYKLNDQSGGPVITGWITAFFPYMKDWRTGRADVPFHALLGRDPEDEPIENLLYPGDPDPKRFVVGLTIESLPAGLSKAPFAWEHRGRKSEMEFLGGFVGVAQDPETLALRPEIGWAVREAPTAG